MVNEDAANGWLDATFRAVAYTGPSDVYAALFDDHPDSGGAEISGDGYARVAITFDPASGGEIESGPAVEFPAAQDDWGEVKYIALYDSQTGGDRIVPAQATPTVDVLAGMVYRIKQGGYVVTVP